MFKLFKKEKKAVVVYTKRELQHAIKRKEPNIEVGGELAQKLKWITKISPAKIVALIGFLSSAVIPNPTSGVSALTATGIVGTDVACIIFTSGISIAIILAVLRGYNVEVAGDRVKLTAK